MWPSWRPCALPSSDLFHRWLTDTGSLTARLVARSQRLSVQVLSQKRARPHVDEAAVLGLRQGELALLREVLLIADGRPVVYARSLVAPQSVRRGWQLFVGIGQRPLGEALFADPQIARGRLAARRLTPRDPRYHRAASLMSGAPTHFWARRSSFVRRGQTLLVCEIFFPDVLRLEPV
jgi:chorismate lyase